MTIRDERGLKFKENTMCQGWRCDRIGKLRPHKGEWLCPYCYKQATRENGKLSVEDTEYRRQLRLQYRVD